MGEVYRARDTRLDRTVAIKVLPAHLAANPERARSVSSARPARSRSLNHPHICTLYDVGHHDGHRLPGHGATSRARRSPHRLAKGPLPLPTSCCAIGGRDRRRPRQGAPRGHHPPRPQARQHHADQAPARSCWTSAWPSADRRCRSRRPALTESPTVQPAADRRGHDRRHAASTWRRSSSRARRPTRAPTSSPSARALRDGHRPAGLRGQEPGEPDRAPSCTSEPPADVDDRSR